MSEQNKRHTQYEFSALRKNVESLGNNSVSSPQKSVFRQWVDKNLTLLVTLSGVFIGLIEGFILRSWQPSEDTIMLVSYPGEMFMRALKLMMLPLIFSSLIAGTSTLNAKMSGRIALRTLIYFVSTNAINVLYGMGLGLVLFRTTGTDQHDEDHVSQNSTALGLRDSLMDLGRNLVPDNLIQALFQQVYTTLKTVEKVSNITTDNVTIRYIETQVIREQKYRYGTNTMGLAFFCLTFGTFLGTVGPKGKQISDLFVALFEVTMKMVSTIILWIAPLGISSIIASKILGIHDMGEVLSQLALFVGIVFFAIFSYQWVGMQLIYFIFLRRNPYKFYAALIEPLLTAFATSSSAATLPVSFRVTENVLGIDTRIVRFVLPIGTSVNTDGTAAFMAIAVLFLTKLNGMVLSVGQLITVFLTTTLTSMSGINIPSGSLILLQVVLQAIDGPVDDISLLFTIDWLLDRIRTGSNVLGDAYAAAVIEHLSKDDLAELDQGIATEIHEKPEKKFSLSDAILHRENSDC